MWDIQILHVPLLPLKCEDMVYINSGINRWPTASIGSIFRNFIEKIAYFFQWLFILSRVEIAGEDLDRGSHIFEIRCGIANTHIQQVACLFSAYCRIFLPVEMGDHDDWR